MKRSLHEATARKGRKIKNVIGKRNEKNTKQLKGLMLNDQVRVFGKVVSLQGLQGQAGLTSKRLTGSTSRCRINLINK